MKNIHIKTHFIALASFLLVGMGVSVNAQTLPAGFPTGQSTETVKAWLKTNYWDGKHITHSYNVARKFMYSYIDNQGDSLTCVYGGTKVYWAYGTETADPNPWPINCEHTVPQSFFAKAEPMVSDIHHLFPTYSTWNSTRSNYPFGDVQDASATKWMINQTSQTAIPGSNINGYSEIMGTALFEPRESHKGNLARAIFYFYTMYPTQAGAISQVGDVATLYQWHLADPVDAAEISRNNAIQTYQGDRNPFIDYPDAVAYAFNVSGGGSGSSGGTGGSGGSGGTGGGSGTGLFISEYIEGSANNKAIEIANFTGASVNLSGYSLKKQTNGAGAWSAGLNLSGTIANGDVYLVVNSGSVAGITSIAELSTAAGEMAFNGNDAVGLFNNGTLTDVVGTFDGGSASFAENKTLVRKASVTGPSTTYTAGNWDVYGNDVFTYAGSHTINQAVTPPATPTGVAVSSSATTLTLSWTDVATETGYTIYRSTDNNTFTSLATVGANVVSYADAAVSVGLNYYYYVVATNSGGNSGNSLKAYGYLPVTYCASAGGNSTYEWIDWVAMHSVNNSSGSNGGYANNTGMVADLIQGATDSVYVSAGFASTQYTEYWGIWIDYNRDGDFADAGEAIILNGTTTDGNNYFVGFTVPATATLGPTRMRVAMKYNAAITSSCESFTYGEVEDYGINILMPSVAFLDDNDMNVFNESNHVQGAAMAKNDLNVAKTSLVEEVNVYPNPFQDQISITYSIKSRDEHQVSITIYNMIGEVMAKVENDGFKSEGTHEATFDASVLKKGMYIVKVVSDGNESVKKIVKF